MAVAPVLVVNFSFNPPVVSIAGPILESTIGKLSDHLPHLSTISARGRKPPPSFEFRESPQPHWYLEMPTLLADELSQLSIMLAVLDCLEDEGGWGMHDTHATTGDYIDHYTFFFTKKTQR
jgi:hypothetical protein